MATYNFTVRAEDDRGAFSDRTFSIQVQNNLVDRMLIIDKDHAYASVNGVNFVERTGKGGRRAHYMLNKWVVMNIDNATYRISDDTINWIEDLKFTTAMDDIKPEHRNITFQCDDGVFFEYGGYVYCVGFTTTGATSTQRNKIAVFRTQDWVNWYMVDGSLNFGNLNFGANATIKHYELSNIVRYNGKFMIYSNRDKSFYLTEDFVTYEKKTLINGNLLFSFGANTSYAPEYSRISVVNSVVQIYIESFKPGSSATIRADYMITTDLTNLITPSRDKSGGFIGKGNTAFASSIVNIPQFQGYTPKSPIYYNGSNLFVFGRNGILDTANPLQPIARFGATSNGYNTSYTSTSGYLPYIPTHSNLVVFDGKLLGYRSTSATYAEKTITGTSIADVTISGITGFAQVGNRYSDIAVRG